MTTSPVVEKSFLILNILVKDPCNSVFRSMFPWFSAQTSIINSLFTISFLSIFNCKSFTTSPGSHTKYSKNIAFHTIIFIDLSVFPASALV